MTRREWIASAALAELALSLRVRSAEAPPASAPVFPHRGYYVCFMRQPTFGLQVWNEILDAASEDGANILILWLAGAFRSKKFPITWQWAKEHENVKADFVRDLIAHAHTRGIRILLGFTPFGYDGVNQLPLEKPHLKAIAADGNPVEEFGIGCWGWNLCPAREESQNFMREYIREMVFDFYPECDGLFIESSDYAICHCPHCGPGFFDHEFAFVRDISREVWARKPDASVVVYPHYFSGAKLKFSFSEATASRQPFDPRWTLFFTPHSAALEPGLIARARGALWSDDALCRMDIAGIRANARRARDGKCTGYIPSFESFSYIASKPEFGESWVVGRRQIPFGFGWVPTGANPYNELPIRALRLAYRELSTNPDLPDDTLHSRLGQTLFGPAWNQTHLDDLFTLLRILTTDRTWSAPGALTSPALVKSRATQNRLDNARRTQLRTQLTRVRQIAVRHQSAAKNTGGHDLHRIAQWISEQWTPENIGLLDDH
jgi:hypothetical protein